MKKVMMVIAIILGIMMILFTDATQSLIFFSYAIMQYLQVYKKYKNGHWIFGLAVVWTIVNIYATSIADIIFWAAIAYANKEVL